jgi:hypothetical protein
MKKLLLVLLVSCVGIPKLYAPTSQSADVGSLVGTISETVVDKTQHGIKSTQPEQLILVVKGMLDKYAPGLVEWVAKNVPVVVEIIKNPSVIEVIQARVVESLPKIREAIAKGNMPEVVVAAKNKLQTHASVLKDSVASDHVAGKAGKVAHDHVSAIALKTDAGGFEALGFIAFYYAVFIDLLEHLIENFDDYKVHQVAKLHGMSPDEAKGMLKNLHKIASGASTGATNAVLHAHQGQKSLSPKLHEALVVVSTSDIDSKTKSTVSKSDTTQQPASTVVVDASKVPVGV